MRTRLTHLVAAVVISFLWVDSHACWRMASRNSLLSAVSTNRFAPQLPVLFGVGFLALSPLRRRSLRHSGHGGFRQSRSPAFETSILAREAELKALKAQVNPHFLFNSLNSISALTSVDPAKAREMCILLAEFLRMTLGLGEKTAVPLSEELSLLHRYLAIEKVRFGARLNLEEEIPQESQAILLAASPSSAARRKCRHPRHRQSPRRRPRSSFRPTATMAASLLAVENTFDPDSTPMRNGGLGLKNVQQRLDARYGKDATCASALKMAVFAWSCRFHR